MKRLMLFVEPTAAQLHIFSMFTLPRLGSFILAGIVNRDPSWSARVFIEGRERFELASWIRKHGKPDVVGISTITATAGRGYGIAAECRKAGIPVIMGGPHVTFLSAEALKHADLVVRGEGEIAMKALLALWKDGFVERHNPAYHDVPNLSWIDQNRVIWHNKMAEFVADLDSLPFPDFALADGTADCRVGKTRLVSVQTSRGCPFDCSFCSVTPMFGKKFRHRSVASVLEELRQYNTKHHFVFFCDDNFTANKARARELLTAMITEKFCFRWSTQVRADIARDPSLIALMKRAGCHTLYIGLESVNPRSLAEMKKNQTVEDIRKAARAVESAGIHLHGMFVFGFEEDRWDTVEATVRFAEDMNLTSAQLLILTPLPGSELYRTLTQQGRVTSRNWDMYDAHHVVFQPAGFSPFELQCAHTYGHTRLYTLRRTVAKFLTGRFLAAELSLYAWKINRQWQIRNQEYLRELYRASYAPSSAQSQSESASMHWVDATRRPAYEFLAAPTA